jgi:hypothetical protein
MLYNGISNFNDAERIAQKKIKGVYLVFSWTIETYYNERNNIGGYISMSNKFKILSNITKASKADDWFTFKKRKW